MDLAVVDCLIDRFKVVWIF